MSYQGPDDMTRDNKEDKPKIRYLNRKHESIFKLVSQRLFKGGENYRKLTRNEIL